MVFWLTCSNRCSAVPVSIGSCARPCDHSRTTSRHPEAFDEYNSQSPATDESQDLGYLKEPGASCAEEGILKIDDRSDEDGILIIGDYSTSSNEKFLPIESHAKMNTTPVTEPSTPGPMPPLMQIEQTQWYRLSHKQLEQEPLQQHQSPKPQLEPGCQQEVDPTPARKLEALASPEHHNKEINKVQEKENISKDGEMIKQNSEELSGSTSPRKVSSLKEHLPFWSNTDAQECGFFFFATGAFLELQHMPNGPTWADFLAPAQPTLINGKDLIGPWQDCMHAAVVYENSHPKWQDDPEYAGGSAPTKQVLEYFEACGHSDHYAALQKAMLNSRKRLQSSGASGISSSRCSSRAASPSASVQSSRQSPVASVVSSRHSRFDPVTMSRDSW